MNLKDANRLDTAGWNARADRLRPEGRHFIDGDFTAAADGATFTKTNPATGQPLGEIARGRAADIDRAVKSARRAFKSGVWSRMAPRERMNVLYRYAALIEAHSADFAVLDVLDVGKPVRDMLDADIPMSVETFQYFAETIDKLDGQVTNTAADALHYILRQPLGVVGCIVPWNYPLMMAAWKVAPALAAGNTVVLKPAEQSPLSAGLLARLFVEAGGPPGVFNVVQGYGEEAGEALALHNDVDKIAFTGSVEIGKKMMVYSGQSNMKRVTTECGGKTPQSIMADYADIDTAVQYAVDGIYANQGEVCNASSRLLVQDSIHDAFIEKFEAVARRTYVPGDPLDPATRMGSMVDTAQQRRVLDYVGIGQGEGAALRFGGGVPEGREAGAYVEPALFTGVNNTMRIAREEIFGPVATVLPIKDMADAVETANDTVFGLAAGIWTDDLTRAHKMVRDIEADVVWVNCFDHGDMTQPWGGFKQSGFGHDKCFESMLHHTQTKSVWINLPD